MAHVSAGHTLTDGLGGWFAQRITTTAVAIAAASAAVIGFAMAGWPLLPLGRRDRRRRRGRPSARWPPALIVGRRGGLDGDGLGAIVELSVLAGLASAALAAV